VRMAEEREPAGGLHQGYTMRSEDSARDGLPVSGDGKRTLSDSRRSEHGAEDGGWYRAYPARRRFSDSRFS
jgi:hypothetical protein